ncbi:AraC family transcriptional regulator [Dysgonomonas sp. Marseille-P4361]|uniref:AraC family transcriptional regulator n=1 Tax=Dysgonomonas sp. Marseille-P4361 TaxID=2161820 RepID=UPI000D54F619|nr:AraC family transcriptional regulator [Dysgonomonas sp. Marseille-P4361]
MEKTVRVKYLIASDQDILWGLTINSVGYQRIEKDSPYPPRNHPTRYLFSTEKGRVLDEYQLLYITRGRGTFTSDSQKRITIKEGHMFLLFPGEWHSYRPDLATGWDEYWIGFKGINIDNRIQHGFFNKEKPLFNVGIRDDIVQLYKQAIEIAKEQNTGFQPMLAGVVNHLLGLAYSQNKHASFEELKVIKQINKAKIIMQENFHLDMSPEEVAQEVHMSYSWFRRIFKQYTGFPPSQYLLELKLQRSKELLTNTAMTSQEVAFEVGFENSDYFCTVFRKKTGMTPIAYREMTQGRNL